MEADRQTNRPTGCRESDIQKFNRQTVRQSDGQTFRQLDSQAVRPLDRRSDGDRKGKEFFHPEMYCMIRSLKKV